MSGLDPSLDDIVLILVNHVSITVSLKGITNSRPNQQEDRQPGGQSKSHCEFKGLITTAVWSENR